MIFYLTYNDLPSGIFSSQVIDVVSFLRKNLNIDIRLISFISIRKFSLNRSKIKKQLPDAIVLPMFPGVQRWYVNKFILYFLLRFFNPKIIIGRSVIATQLALRSRKKNMKVVYDGRGAIFAEWHEYKVVNNSKLVSSIFKLEREAVLDSDYRIAVSNKLIEYWKKEFEYDNDKHVVIPCTLNKKFEALVLDEKLIKQKRFFLGLNESDIVFIYSGSVAGWQSFDLLVEFIRPVLKFGKQFKIVFFSEPSVHIDSLIEKFPDQVIFRNLKPDEVAENMIVGNYGLLIREQSTTNEVASPVKFAEYLACGLKVIISPKIGDYSSLISSNIELGTLVDYSNFEVTPNSFENKLLIRNIGLKLYTKSNYIQEYKRLIS